MSAPAADIIDLLAGIGPADPLAAVRDQRAQARANAQRSFEALLEPTAPGTFPLAERYAVALFVARLHGFDAAEAFYGDLLGDEAPELEAVVADAATVAAATGPFGGYREPNLRGESAEGLRWSPDTATAQALGERLSAAFAHTHLLVFRPREARAEALQALVDAGWSADDIVSLSQLVAFLTFELRVAWGLRVLAAASATAAAAASTPVAVSAAVTEGA